MGLGSAELVGLCDARDAALADPVFGKASVDAIDVNQVVDLLDPIWTKGDYQRLFNLLRGHDVATYDLTTFLVWCVGVKGPLLRELAGDSREFRDIAKYQMENTLLGDDLEPEMVYPADGRPPEQLTLDRKARHLGMSAEELVAFRDGVRDALLGPSASGQTRAIGQICRLAGVLQSSRSRLARRSSSRSPKPADWSPRVRRRHCDLRV